MKQDNYSKIRVTIDHTSLLSYAPNRGIVNDLMINNDHFCHMISLCTCQTVMTQYLPICISHDQRVRGNAKIWGKNVT